MTNEYDELARNVTRGYSRTLDEESEPFIRQDIIDAIRTAVEAEREAIYKILFDLHDARKYSSIGIEKAMEIIRNRETGDE